MPSGEMPPCGFHTAHERVVFKRRSPLVAVIIEIYAEVISAYRGGVSDRAFRPDKRRDKAFDIWQNLLHQLTRMASDALGYSPATIFIAIACKGGGDTRTPRHDGRVGQPPALAHRTHQLLPESWRGQGATAADSNRVKPL